MLVSLFPCFKHIYVRNRETRKQAYEHMIVSLFPRGILLPAEEFSMSMLRKRLGLAGSSPDKKNIAVPGKKRPSATAGGGSGFRR
jgi:hypothetical protein